MSQVYGLRLNAPKLPIINIVTAPSVAVNRTGTGPENTDLDRRWSTRPQDPPGEGAARRLDDDERIEKLEDPFT